MRIALRAQPSEAQLVHLEQGTPERPPNNWLSVFGGPAWKWDETTREWYQHLFLAAQPDLNFRNPEVVQRCMR